MGYALLASCCTMIAVRLLDDGPRDLAAIGLRANCSAAGETDVSMTLVLALLTVAVKQGSSIPGALDAVGESMGGVCGGGLRRAAVSLRSGTGWHHAWLAARAEAEKTTVARETGGGDRPHAASRPGAAGCADDWRQTDAGRLFDVLEEALEPAWRRGASPIMRLEAAADQLDSDERARIEEAAGRLSVRLLLPTGLCFLPSFIIVGVVPAIASFLL